LERATVRLPTGILPARLVRADRVMLVGWIVAIADLPIQLLDAGGRTGTETATVVTAIALTSVMTVQALRIARVPGLPERSRRFWNALGAASTIFIVGQLVDLAILMAPSPATAELIGLGQRLIYPVGDLAALLALMRYPAMERRAAEQVRLGLDIAILTLAAGSFLWYFSLGPSLGALTSPLEVVPLLFQPIATLVMLLLLAKAVLGGANILDRRTLLFIAAGTCLSAAQPIVALETDGPGGRGEHLVITGVQVLIALGLTRQYMATAEGTTLVPRPKRQYRPFSVLPYLAGIATFGLLLWVSMPMLGPRRAGVAVVAVALAATVIARQLAALQENSRLLADNLALTARLEYQAFHDGLTGLANRTLFEQELERLLLNGEKLALLFVDLDDFKQVNDQRGHRAGDAVLVQVARRLRSCVRDEDMIARLGGDEFAILSLGEPDAAACLAGRLVTAFAQPFDLCGDKVRISASVGFAVNEDCDLEAVLHRADLAMYAAKQAGKGRFAPAPVPAPAGG
jgi:diguanylate cyclase (GGDEF)-like protein